MCRSFGIGISSSESRGVVYRTRWIPGTFNTIPPQRSSSDRAERGEIIRDYTGEEREMATTQPRSVEVPVGVTDSAGRPAWGSDVVMDMLRLLDVEYAAVLPGSSFRGIHDSAVNYTANTRPELILCNHEMICVSFAKGYARAA